MLVFRRVKTIQGGLTDVMRSITPPAWAALKPFILAVAVLSSALVSTSPASAEKHLIRGNAGEPKSLDPHRATGVWENQVIGDMLMGLYTEDASEIGRAHV